VGQGAPPNVETTKIFSGFFGARFWIPLFKPGSNLLLIMEVRGVDWLTMLLVLTVEPLITDTAGKFKFCPL
jgi:hypothetical protein